MKAPRARASALLVSLCAAALVSGCASFDDLAPQSQRTDPASLAAEQSLAAATLSSAGWPSVQWWQALGDAQLDALIGEALQGNPGMGAARSRIDRARALAANYGAALETQVNAAAGVARQRHSGNGVFPPPIAGAWRTQSDLALSASYDFDLWGRSRAAYDAALGQARAAEVDAQAARLALAASVARAYVLLGRSFDQLALAEATLKRREALLDLTRRRVAAGLDSDVDLTQVEGTLPAARQRIAQLEEEIALGRNLLAALTGQGPDRGLAITRPQLKQPAPTLPSTLAADLLGRRPDVVAQRWRVEAASRDIDAAKSRFYPNLNLNGLIGLQSIRLGKLLDAQSANPAFGSALRLPLFDGGRLRANLAAKHADYDAAVEQYNQILVDALREVLDQLASLKSLQAQKAELEQALASARSAHALALARYRAGIAGYVQVLAAESALLEQDILRAGLRARELELAINLTRALGGGYDESAAQAASRNAAR